MFLRVSCVLRNKSFVLRDLSKLTTIDKIRSLAGAELDVADLSALLLICKGKVLEDGQTCLNYRIEDGNTVLVQIRRKADEEENLSNASKSATVPEDAKIELEPGDSVYFNVGDPVDVQDLDDGSWNEAKIEKICKKPPSDFDPAEQGDFSDGLVYFCRYDHFDIVQSLPLRCVRPRACEKIDVERQSANGESHQRYLVNYNFDAPGELGDWYEAELHFGQNDATIIARSIAATIFAIGNAAIPNCKVTKLDEIYLIPDRCAKQKLLPVVQASTARTTLDCRFCFDNCRKKPTCTYCLCAYCRSDNDPDKLLVCDECQQLYHTVCLTPPLAEVPENDWYCPQCDNRDDKVIKSGEAAKLLTKRLLNSASAKTKKAWGKKNACDGVSKKCFIVPRNHFGPIPGVEVGTCWKYRKQVAEAGVHRPLVAGIHGKTGEAAYSIVSSGGYKDDADEGDRLIYTGSGGRDLSGNKRRAKQSKDQTLEKFNASLARNCYSLSGKISSSGYDAGQNWKKGKPLRVVRSWKSKEYGPTEGFRYDGIYKVTKYWPEKGCEGFIVWRYELQRDDPTPAPWTKAGKALIRKKGLETMIQPDDGLETKSKTVENGDGGTCNDDGGNRSATSSGKNTKRPKFAAYSIPANQLKLMKNDKRNDALWAECLAAARNGSMAFFEKLAEVFTCAVCQDVVDCPVTLACSHTLCLICVQRAKKSDYDYCPSCRQPLGDDAVVNENLKEALESLMPNYAKGRGGKETKRGRGNKNN